MVDSYFLRHEPCPKCGSRDNLGVWSDGHKYCFGCRYYELARETPENLRRRVGMTEDNNNNDEFLDTSGFRNKIPDDALKWLKKYGISDNEIKHYCLCWNEETNSLVFPIFNDNNKLVYYQERYFGPKVNYPKYITRGSKTQQLGYITNRNFNGTIVLVEDFVSAIKVGRYCTVAPLLGSVISAEAVKWIVENFWRVRVWLDMDKAVESLKQASKVPVKDIRIILTQFDPKDYTTQEIVKVLEGHDLRLKKNG